MKRLKAMDQKRTTPFRSGSVKQIREKEHTMHPVLHFQQLVGNQGILALKRREQAEGDIFKNTGIRAAERNPAMNFPFLSVPPAIQRQNDEETQTDFTAEQLSMLKKDHVKANEMLSNVITICKEIFIFIPAKGENLNENQKIKSTKTEALIAQLFGKFNPDVLADIIWNCDLMKSSMKGIQYAYDASVDTAEASQFQKVIKIGNGFLKSNIYAQYWILLHEIGHLAGLKHTGGFQGLVFMERPTCPADIPVMQTEDAVRNAEINAAFVYCAYYDR